MRGRVALTVGLLALAAPVRGQSPATSPTAEQMIETAREVYSVDAPEAEPCPTPTGTEIVVCRQLEDGDEYRVASPTERARAEGRMPLTVARSAEVAAGKSAEARAARSAVTGKMHSASPR